MLDQLIVHTASMNLFSVYGPMLLIIVGVITILGSIVYLITQRRKKKLNKKKVILSIVLIFLGLLLMFFFRITQVKAEIPPILTTYGPGTGPTIPVVNAIRFLLGSGGVEKVQEIAVNPASVPPPLTNKQPQHHKIELEAKEVLGELASGSYFNFWTFNGTIPGPFLRIRVGDTVDLNLKNNLKSINMHNIDLHAVTGPGGGATVTNLNPGESKSFTFKALNPGIYVYHCAHGNAATHMAHGMYGLILVEPEEGLPKVDKEFYVMQGEYYTVEPTGGKGLQVFDANKMLAGIPDYITFNGRVNGTVGNMVVNKGDKVRLYVGNGGVNLVSSFHIIGEIFDTVYPEGSMGPGTLPLKNIQSTVVPAGGATIVEFVADVPGKYVLVDHALARTDKGAWGTIEVRGEASPDIFNGQPESNQNEHSGH